MNNKTNIEEDIKIIKKYEILELGISSELSDENEITLERYNKAIENILADRERAIEENTSLKAENQKKAKTINEMAEWINKIDSTIFCNKEKCNDNCKECVKQYFERKIQQ